MKIGEDGLMACPACGEWVLHFGEVSVSVAPEDDYIVDKFTFEHGFERGIGSRYKPEIERNLKSRLRGGSVRLGFWCETCGAAWIETFTFHKGRIVAEAALLDDESAQKWSGYPPDKEWPEEEVYEQDSRPDRPVEFWALEPTYLRYTPPSELMLQAWVRDDESVFFSAWTARKKVAS